MKNVLAIAYDLINKCMPARGNDVVVFDIDETLIDVGGEPIFEVIDFYRYVRTIGFKTSIITAREETDENVNFTIKELSKFGINDYHSIYFREPSQMNIEQYKLNSRKKLSLDGFNTVMSVGDMYWDAGGYGGIGIII